MKKTILFFTLLAVVVGKGQKRMYKNSLSDYLYDA